jgi:CheY-like chemotaxis protein
MGKQKNDILLVDDDLSDIELILRAFKACGVSSKISYVTDGLQAIAYLLGEGIYSDRDQYPYPSFIITDLKMQGIDGLGVLEHLKANPAWAIIPTVVLSSSEDPDDIRNAYLLGASSYHVKPDKYENLCYLVKTLYAYWMTCAIPDVDITGKQLITDSKGKLGERFKQPVQSVQTRVQK